MDLVRIPAESAPARIAPLAVLPVFLDLRGRRALVAGGSDAAAWKAELLAAAGAQVDVLAPEPGPAMAALLAANEAVRPVSGRVEVVIVGCAAAVCDAADDADAAQFAAAARAAGVPHNVIDRPGHCSFQFGAIVNRSPVVVGISTDGAAPILGQAIRRRIETVLPPALAGWARLARRVREAVHRRLAPGDQRRRFWEAVAERAFAGPRPRRAVRQLVDAARGETAARTGRVTLVGAGPGDPEHLTLKAVRALQSADVILFDDLVADGVLELARREAKRMIVGKRGGRASCRQEDINALMLRLARAGKHVVRLKSGDPAIFGRAGEEIAELSAAGIPVAVVPGITAAAAMAAGLGTSLTHREGAHSVRFVTGHSRDGTLPEGLDWHGLADPDTTLVVYMGGRTAGGFAARLIAEGADPATPAVVAESVSCPGETYAASTLAGLAAGGVGARAGPVIIAIGRTLAAAAAGLAAPIPEPAPLLRTGT